MGWWQSRSVQLTFLYCFEIAYFQVCSAISYIVPLTHYMPPIYLPQVIHSYNTYLILRQTIISPVLHYWSWHPLLPSKMTGRWRLIEVLQSYLFILNTISLKYISECLFDHKSMLVKAWGRQAPSHYLIVCWPRSMTSHALTRSQWDKRNNHWYRIILLIVTGWFFFVVMNKQPRALIKYWDRHRMVYFADNI